MALDKFGVIGGISIENQALTAAANILIGTGAPGGDTGEQDAAPIGSLYLRTNAEADDLQVYFKHSIAGGDATDWKQATSKEYVDAIAMGLSWREPAKLHDSTTYADLAAVKTAIDATDEIDGVTIVGGERVLFSAITGDNNNVYVVTGTSGDWTFTEDTNLATDGDALFIQQGTTHAEQQWVYNGTSWVQFGAGDQVELGYIRAFIGKGAAGNETPNYSSNEYVVDGTSLETAIGALDSTLGTGTITNITANEALSDNMLWGGGTLTTSTALNNLNDAIGDRSYTNDDVVTDGQSVAASIDALDATYGSGSITNQAANEALSDDMIWGGGTLTTTTALNNLNDAIGDRSYTNDNVVTDGQSVAASIDAIDSAIGDRTYTEDNVVTDGQTLTASIDALDVALGALQDLQLEVTGSNVDASPAVIVDAIALTLATQVKWIIQIRETSTAGKRSGLEVHALTDGTTVDYNNYSLLKLGGGVAGLKATVSVGGGNIRLHIEANNNVDYVIKRITYSSF